MAASDVKITLNMNPSFTTSTTGWLSEQATYDEFLYGRTKARTFVPADPPDVITVRREALEAMLCGPRPVPDYPRSIFVGDYLNALYLPFDWDPTAHLKGEGEWPNRTRFWSEGPMFKFKRIPVAPRLPG